MHGNCNVPPLTGPRFVFSRDISTSRYRCVCKSAGIISQMQEVDYKRPMNKNRRDLPDNGHSGCLCWQWRGHPHDIFPYTGYTTILYVYTYIYINVYCIQPWYSPCMSIKSWLYETQPLTENVGKLCLWTLLLKHMRNLNYLYTYYVNSQHTLSKRDIRTSSGQF